MWKPAHLDVFPLHRHRPEESRRGLPQIQVQQRPLLDPTQVLPQLHDARRLVGPEGDDAGVEVAADSEAGGFEDGFFSGPGAVEGVGPLGFGEAHQYLMLARCEEATGEGFEVFAFLDLLDVDPETTAGGNGEEGLIFGVRKIEDEVGFVGAVQERLAVLTDLDLDPARILVEIAAEDGAHGPSPDREATPVSLEVEAIGSLSFLGGEDLSLPVDLGGLGLEVDLPQVDLARCRQVCR